jgi:hypothetical protein
MGAGMVRHHPRGRDVRAAMVSQIERGTYDSDVLAEARWVGGFPGGTHGE